MFVQARNNLKKNSIKVTSLFEHKKDIVNRSPGYCQLSSSTLIILAGFPAMTRLSVNDFVTILPAPTIT